MRLQVSSRCQLAASTMSEKSTDGNPSSNSEGATDKEQRQVDKVIAKDAAKDIKYREEWEEEKKVVTVQELKAWYWYDFAMSGYPSCKYSFSCG